MSLFIIAIFASMKLYFIYFLFDVVILILSQRKDEDFKFVSSIFFLLSGVSIIDWIC